jgi:hypothetical protein
MEPNRLLRRVAGMGPREIRDRVTTSVRREAARLAHRARAATWQRQDLTTALVPWSADLASAVAHLDAGRADDAHHALAHHFATRARRWPVVSSLRDPVVRAIRERCPGAAEDAVRRADAIAAGRFDLLGYRGLGFAPPGGDPDAIDWHRDPVHGRSMPRRFWSDVPYLDPAGGDHKIIWELNRHQHFLALGRAWWLAGHRPARATFVRHLTSWFDANPPLVGANWASMLELALRSLSWIWALECFVEPVAPDGRPRGDDPGDAHPWIVDLLLGLDRQLHLVEQNLSTYFSPNTHLLGEALALYVAGRALPELRRASTWAELGRRVLIDEMARQIAPDGGHVEGTLHYHRYTLDFYLLALTVARLTRDDARPFAEAVRRLARFARLLADDAGRLARIGDDDGGQLLPIAGRDAADVGDSLALAGWLLGDASLAVGQTPEEALWMSGGGAALAGPSGAPAAIGSATCRDSGYTVCRSPHGDHLIFDAGPHGYLNGGHAHADALSLTLTVAGRPLIVDPGTACYTIDPARRDSFRSTRLHNTLLVDGRSQSEPAGPFHWRTATAATRLAWCTTSRFDFVEGAHDGYAPLRHRRAVLARSGCWVVADRLIGRGAHRVDLHWHLDPRWTVARVDDVWVRADDGAGVPVWIATLPGTIEIVRGGDPEPELGWMSPAYGVVAPTTTLRVTQRLTTPGTILTAIVAAAACPAIEALPVMVGGAADPTAAALRLRAADVVDTVLFGSLGPDAERNRCGSAAGFETDAALLWAHTGSATAAPRVAIVDGSVVRTRNGRAPIDLTESVACRDAVV